MLIKNRILQYFVREDFNSKSKALLSLQKQDHLENKLTITITLDSKEASCSSVDLDFSELENLLDVKITPNESE